MKCIEESCSRNVRPTRGRLNHDRVRCFECDRILDRSRRSEARKTALASAPAKQIDPSRWRANRPVAVSAHEIVIDQFHYGSFAFVVTDAAVYFSHATALRNPDPSVHPAIHRVSLQGAST